MAERKQQHKPHRSLTPDELAVSQAKAAATRAANQAKLIEKAGPKECRLCHLLFGKDKKGKPYLAINTGDRICQFCRVDIIRFNRRQLALGKVVAA